MNQSLTSFRIGKYGLEVEPYDKRDVRGLLLVWEPPSEAAGVDYSLGCDPTAGVLGWSRATRSDEDWKHDNAAIEVFRTGVWYFDKELKQNIKNPDVQVAEWAGPIDAQELAYVINFIGRLYGGSHEDKQALATIEIQPGPGWLTQRELQDKYGYTRFLPWLKTGKYNLQYDTGIRGWISNQHTRRDLWTRSGGHLKKRGAVLRSEWLVEEMAQCTPDNFIAMTARAQRLGKSGLNDDRVVAALLSLWACNEWQIGQETIEPTPVTNTEAPDWQTSAMTSEEMMEAWNARVQELQD